MATLKRALVALNGQEGPEYAEAEDGSIKPCYLVSTGDSTTTKIRANPTDGKPIGVADCADDHDLNTAYTAGDSVPYWKLGSGVTIYVLYDDGSNSETFYQNQTFISSNNTAGAAELWSRTSKSSSYDATEFTERSDTPLNYKVGKPAWEQTITASAFVAIDLI
jgi:hypothetical protein